MRALGFRRVTRPAGPGVRDHHERVEIVAGDERILARPGRAWRGVGLALLALAVVIGAVFLDSTTVTSNADQADLAFGLPLAWVEQDQSSLEPPFPAEASVLSPNEYPTRIAWLPFVADVALVLGTLALLGVAGRWLVLRLQRP